MIRLKYLKNVRNSESENRKFQGFFELFLCCKIIKRHELLLGSRNPYK